MKTIKLRQVGGSVMLTVPPTVLERLKLSSGSEVTIYPEQNGFQVKPAQKRYTLDELLAQCDPDAPRDPESREWLDAPAIGREEL